MPIRRVLFFFCLIIFFHSCKKSGSENPYYIRASVNSAEKFFNINATAKKADSNGLVTITLSAYLPSKNNQENILLMISNLDTSKLMARGIYSSLNNDGYSVTGVYVSDSASTQFDGGLFPSYDNPLKIIITSIDDQTIKGTFTGNFYYMGSSPITEPGPGKKAFYNGEFYVKFLPSTQ